MKKSTKSIAAFCLLFLSLFTSRAQYMPDALSALNDSETVRSFKKHVATVSASAMEGRKAGSEGEKMTAEYLTEVLKGYGLDVLTGVEGDVFGLKQDNGDTLTSRNVCAFIHGGDKSLRDRYIVIGARMDNLGTSTMTVDGEKVEKIYYGANGNASGLAMLLELARMLQTNRQLLRRSVLLMGFGASGQTCAGSWYFLNRSFSDVANIDAMINLDMVGLGGNGFHAYTASNADMNDLVETLSRELHPIKPELTGQEPYPSDHRTFYAKEIPSIFFTTGQYPEHGTERDTQSILDFETMEMELEYVYDFSVALINGQKPLFNPSDMAGLTVGGNGIVPYYDCDVKPTFLGSPDPRVFLKKWVYTYMKYPKVAVRNGIQGKVLVDFVINENGKVQDVKVSKGADPLLDEEAVRIVSSSPDWKPARVRGKKVKSAMSLYVEFRLEKNGMKRIGFKKHEN